MDVATDAGTIGTPPAVVWDRRIGGDELDVARAVVRAPDGDVVVAGFTTEDGDRDAWLARVNSDGTLEWSQRYGGEGLELARDVVGMPTGGFAFVGSTRAPSADESNIWLVEVGSDGTIEETRTFDPPGDARGIGLVPASDGEYTIVGDRVVDDERAPLALRTDGAGDVRWQQTYGGDGMGAVSDVAAGADGVVVTGTTDSAGAGGTDMYLLRLDSQGQVQYDRTFGGSDDDFGSAVARTRDGGLVLAGATRSFAARSGDRDLWLVRTDASGVEQWSRTYGGPRSESSAAVVQSDGGGYTVAGDTYSYGEGRFDAWVVHTDADGAVEWTKTAGDSDQDTTRGLVETTDGGYVVAGATVEAGGGSNDAWLFGLAGTAAPDESRPIEECGTVLDEPGRYVLTTDLRAEGTENCLTIRASDVTLDGDGHRIVGNSNGQGPGRVDQRTGNGVFIESPEDIEQSNITVQNLAIEGFERGIYRGWAYPRVTGLTVRNVTVRESSGTAMMLQDTVDLTVTGNTVVENGMGIDIDEFGAGIEVSDNRIEGNSRTGLFLFEGGERAVISGNVVAGNGRGIWASNGVDDALFTDNQIVDNRGRGIEVSISQGVVIRGNRVSENDGVGIGLDLSDGTIVDNDVASNGGAGISLVYFGEDVTGNRVVENGGDGIYIEQSEGRITDNLARANGGAGITIIESSPEVAGNELVANSGAGVAVTGAPEWDSNTRLVANRIADNCGAGIRFDRGTGVVLANEIGENAACG
jgi:parallel beta-helix repeat protein